MYMYIAVTEYRKQAYNMNEDTTPLSLPYILVGNTHERDERNIEHLLTHHCWSFKLIIRRRLLLLLFMARGKCGLLGTILTLTSLCLATTLLIPVRAKRESERLVNMGG